MTALKPAIGTVVLGLCMAIFGATAQAQNTTAPTTTPDAAHTTPNATTSTNSSERNKMHKQDKQRCDAMQGSEKETCLKEARAKSDSSKSGMQDTQKPQQHENRKEGKSMP